MKILLVILFFILFTPSAFGESSCGTLFSKENQPVASSTIKSDNLFLILTDMLRDFKKRPFEDVWPKYSARYEAFISKNNYPPDYDNTFERQIRAVFTGFQRNFETPESGPPALTAAFANEIIHVIGRVGGPLLFDGVRFEIGDNVQVVSLKNKDKKIATGKVIGILWERHEHQSIQSLILEVGPLNFSDIRLSSITSVNLF